jgi:hypothetical protein
MYSSQDCDIRETLTRSSVTILKPELGVIIGKASYKTDFAKNQKHSSWQMKVHGCLI